MSALAVAVPIISLSILALAFIFGVLAVIFEFKEIGREVYE